MIRGLIMAYYRRKTYSSLRSIMRVINRNNYRKYR